MGTLAHGIAMDTVELLQTRLQRIEYLLTGKIGEIDSTVSYDNGEEHLQTVIARLTSLESSLSRLSSTSPVASDLLKLHKQHRDLFQIKPVEDVPPSLNTANLSSIVLASAPMYPTTASRMTSIQDMPIPSAKASASLITLGPRIEKLQSLQDAQSKELAELRRRSATVLERWYTIGVLSGGECWAEWEGRTMLVEQSLRRHEAEKAREDREI
ncbi:MAG: hypothetical protein M1812_003325 [Candelaria pacifica]|nr:MAG: hypothetical protein M1812_003325 [Candelaria pacifica]